MQVLEYIHNKYQKREIYFEILADIKQKPFYLDDVPIGTKLYIIAWARSKLITKDKCYRCLMSYITNFDTKYIWVEKDKNIIYIHAPKIGHKIDYICKNGYFWIFIQGKKLSDDEYYALRSLFYDMEFKLF